MISAWYIGAGSLISVFTNTPNQAFGKLKSIYGNELIKHGHQFPENKKKFTEVDRLRIKQKIRKEIKKENIKKIIGLLISVFLLIIIIIGFLELVRYLMKPDILKY